MGGGGTSLANPGSLLCHDFGSTMAEAFFADRASYDASARTVTVKHALTSLEAWRVRVLVHMQVWEVGAVCSLWGGGGGRDFRSSNPCWLFCSWRVGRRSC
jgi:hypothetical protein